MCLSRLREVLFQKKKLKNSAEKKLMLAYCNIMLCGTLEVRHSVLISIFFMLVCCNVMMCGTLEVRHSVRHFNFLFIAGFVFLFDWCNKRIGQKEGLPSS